MLNVIEKTSVNAPIDDLVPARIKDVVFPKGVSLFASTRANKPHTPFCEQTLDPLKLPLKLISRKVSAIYRNAVAGAILAAVPVAQRAIQHLFDVVAGVAVEAGFDLVKQGGGPVV